MEGGGDSVEPLEDEAEVKYFMREIGGEEGYMEAHLFQGDTFLKAKVIWQSFSKSNP